MRAPPPASLGCRRSRFQSGVKDFVDIVNVDEFQPLYITGGYFCYILAIIGG